MRPHHTVGIIPLLAIACFAALAARADINIDETIGTTKGWTIGYNESLKGCLASATFADRTTVWIGFDGTEKEVPAYIAFTNPTWQWVEPRKVYDVQIQASGYGNWRGRFFGIERSTEKGLVLAGAKEQFLKDFAHATGIVILLGQKVLSRPNLLGSSAVLDEVVTCQKRRNSVASRQDSQTQKRSFGTAFFVSRAGHLLTNYHVVKGCSAVQVLNSDSNTHQGKLTAFDDRNDLALITTEIAPKVVPAFRTSNVRIGENIWVYGFPLTGLLAASGNFTSGMISAMAGLGNDIRTLQISAPVQPGNSGGPLLDKYGNVVGVVVAKLDALAVASKTNDVPQNVNFAVKSILALNFVQANGARPETDLRTAQLEQVDIAERARSFTVKISCEPTSTASTSSGRDNWNSCANGGGDAAIAACSALITSQQSHGAELG